MVYNNYNLNTYKYGRGIFFVGLNFPVKDVWSCFHTISSILKTSQGKAINKSFRRNSSHKLELQGEVFSYM